MRSRNLAVLLAVPALLLASAGVSQAHSAPRVEKFRAELSPLNQDGDGDVRLAQRGSTLAVHLRAEDLDDGVHVAHIHGVKQASNECPTPAFDNDGNGLVDLVEGLPAYGPVQVTLSQGTNDRGTSLDYKRIYTQLDNGDTIASLGDLDRYAIVVHGVDLDGDGAATNPDVQGDGTGDHDDHEITMPALCGEIED